MHHMTGEEIGWVNKLNPRKQRGGEGGVGGDLLLSAPTEGLLGTPFGHLEQAEKRREGVVVAPIRSWRFEKPRTTIPRLDYSPHFEMQKKGR